MPDNEQLAFDFDAPTEASNYDVTIACGPLHEEEVVRRHTAKTPEDALAIIDGLRDTYGARESVTWNGEEVNPEGRLYGLAPKGLVYVISVVPPLRAW
jgi:hypothetical protein